MIKLFIILFCLLLFVSLVATVIGLIGGRIDQFPIWKTQTWSTFKVPVIVIAVIVGITVLVVIISRTSKKQERAEKQFAQSQGWISTESYNAPPGAYSGNRRQAQESMPGEEVQFE